MRQIFVANPKGGCGKTMLSIHLASHYARQGYQVALCDHDPQQSSLDWLKGRPKHCDPITGIAFFDHQILPNRFDYVVHDLPAACGAEELKTLVPGHQLLIPVLPSPTDIKASVRFLMGLSRLDLVDTQRVGLVANRVNVNTNYFKVLIAFLNHVNLPLIGYLRDTQNYVRAISSGISLFDLPPSAIKVDQAQWQPVLEWLKAPENEESSAFKRQIEELLEGVL